MNPTFANPAALVLLLALPIYAILARRGDRRLPLPRAGALTPGSSILAAAPGAFRVLTLALLALALARPSTVEAVVEEHSGGVPIVLAVDISSSMLARDLGAEDRLGFARGALARFVEAREGDPLGIVAFAGEAITLVPPTTHRALLRSSLEGLEVGLVEDGTAIGDGLAAAINRLRGPDAGGSVIVLLSDGASNRGTVDPLDAAGAAAALGIRVFTVGVGSEDGAAALPADPAAEEGAAGIDVALLTAISSATGGAFYRASDPTTLDRIYEEVDRLVPSDARVVGREARREWTGILLLGAAALLVVEWGIRGSRWGAFP